MIEKDNNCFYCTKDERLEELMISLCEMEYSNVYLLRDQKHRGRCVVAYKKHIREIFEFDEAQRNGFFSDVTEIARVIKNIFLPDKINYAVYGDLVEHFHVHIVPKKAGGLRWGEPFSDEDTKKILSDEELIDVRDMLLKQIKQCD